MTVQRLNRFPLASLLPYLEAGGWDVVIDDTLQAELRDGRGDFRLVVDRNGRAMLRRTVLAERPQERIIHKGKHTYAIQRETTAVVHVSTQLLSGDALDQVLAEMIALGLSFSHEGDAEEGS
jgi:hypothetical protein